MQLLNILVAFDLHHVVDDENDLGIVNQHHLVVFLDYIFFSTLPSDWNTSQIRWTTDNTHSKFVI